MKNNILKHITTSKEKVHKLLAILLDPDKLSIEELTVSIKKLFLHKVDFIFVGGSTVANEITNSFVKKIKELTAIPVVLFPGDFKQLTNEANAVLFLSLLSGRNPEYLIEQQVKSVSFLKKSNLEIIPTGYILINGGIETAVQRVSNTNPISQLNVNMIVDTALAAEYLGKKLVYLEAGSGAKIPVAEAIIKKVSENVKIPIIVGGGIRTKEQLAKAYKNGADLVVIGTAFEENNDALKAIL